MTAAEGRRRLQRLMDATYSAEARVRRGPTAEELVAFLDGYADEIARRVLQGLGR